MPELTDKQAAFVAEYPIDFCAAKAAIRAGYSPNSARQTGHELLGHPAIAEAMAKAQAARAARCGIAADRVLHELAAIGFAEPDETHRVSDSDKIAALGKIGQAIGMFKSRIEHTGADGAPIQHNHSAADIVRRIAFLFAKAGREQEEAS